MGLSEDLAWDCPARARLCLESHGRASTQHLQPERGRAGSLCLPELSALQGRFFLPPLPAWICWCSWWLPTLSAASSETLQDLSSLPHPIGCTFWGHSPRKVKGSPLHLCQALHQPRPRDLGHGGARILPCRQAACSLARLCLGKPQSACLVPALLRASCCWLLLSGGCWLLLTHLPMGTGVELRKALAQDFPPAWPVSVLHREPRGGRR